VRSLLGRIGRWLAAWDRSGGPERELLAEAAALAPWDPLIVPCSATTTGRAFQCRHGHHHESRAIAATCAQP
jgi:hypothetical protein